VRINGIELRPGMEVFANECNRFLVVVRIVTTEGPIRAKDESGRVFIVPLRAISAVRYAPIKKPPRRGPLLGR
jgi:hypothetical protein